MTWRLCGGIVGLTLACALKDSGLSVALIDENSFRRRSKGQAYAFHLLSRRFLRNWGMG